MKKNPDPSWFKRTSMAAIAAGLLVAVLGLVANPATASVNDPSPTPYSDDEEQGTTDCADYGHALEVKINNQPADGVYDLDDLQVKGDVPDDLTITISNAGVVSGRFEFDWSSNYAFSLVLVKQSNEGLAYEYDPAVTNDQDVQTIEGQNSGGISHVTFCNPTLPVDVCEHDETLPADSEDCVPPTDPQAVLSATIACGANGLTVAVANTGDAAGNVDVLSGDALVADDLVVPAAGSAQVMVPVAEEAAYDIEVVGVEEFVGTRDCEDVLPNVIPKTPVKPEVQPTQVAGVQVTPAQELPRTGNTTLPLLQVGVGLMLMGAGALLVGKGQTSAI